MITVTLPDRTLQISFTHPTRKVPEDELNSKAELKFFNQRLTACNVFDASSSIPKPLTTSVHKWPRWDPFSKESGRKLSLKWAMKELGLSKFERLSVWMEYKLHHQTRVLCDKVTVIH